MSATISSVLEDLFNAPLQAAVRAEAEYLRIWAQWLKLNKEYLIIENDDGTKVLNEKVLRDAPIISLDGEIELGITLRIAEVKKKEGKLEAGIVVAPVYGGVGFGMSSKSSQESIFKASSKFVISNQRKDLSEYLKIHQLTNITVDSDEKLTEMIEKLIDDANKIDLEEARKIHKIK